MSRGGLMDRSGLFTHCNYAQDATYAVSIASQGARQGGDHQHCQSQGSALLGTGLRLLVNLAAIDEEEVMAGSVLNMLEHVISTIERQKGSTHSLLIGKAMQFMLKNLHCDISLVDVARHVGISPTRLSQIFKHRIGRSFTELLRECRVNRASDMLRNTEQSIAEVADACGFCDQSYLTRVFQSTKGVTPKRFRNSIQQHDLSIAWRLNEDLVAG
jgi:AraC-like DNA-binding protein